MLTQLIGARLKHILKILTLFGKDAAIKHYKPIQIKFLVNYLTIGRKLTLNVVAIEYAKKLGTQERYIKHAKWRVLVNIVTEHFKEIKTNNHHSQVHLGKYLDHVHKA